MMNLENKPVALTSNTTNACDVSRTKIYRANSPIIYARVMNLNFIAYITKEGVSSINSTMQLYATNANA